MGWNHGDHNVLIALVKTVYRLASVQNVSKFKKKKKKENIYPLTIPLSANKNLCFAKLTQQEDMNFPQGHMHLLGAFPGTI